MNSFDLTIFNFIHIPAGKWFLLDWLVIFFAIYVAYLLCAFLVVLLFNEKDRKKRAYAFAWVVLAMIVSRGIIAQAIHFFYQRTRPFVALEIEPVFNHTATAAFPSGHMALLATLILPVWYLNKKWGWIYLCSVIAVGAARVYGAVHWPTDIIAGIILGVGVSYIVKHFLFKEESELAEELDKEGE